MKHQDKSFIYLQDVSTADPQEKILDPNPHGVFAGGPPLLSEDAVRVLLTQPKRAKKEALDTLDELAVEFGLI